MGRDPARQLFDAAADGNVTLVRQLLAGGADASLGLRVGPDAGFTPWAMTPLAVARDHAEVVGLLVAAGASVEEHDRHESLLARACSLRMIVSLLQRGAGRTSDTSFAPSVVDSVAGEARMSVDDRVTALRLISVTSADLDATKHTLTALWRRACDGDADAVGALLRAGADPRTDPSALAGAVWGSHPGQREYDTPEAINRTIDLLVAAGCDVRERDANGLEPLHGAADAVRSRPRVRVERRQQRAGGRSPHPARRVDRDLVRRCGMQLPGRCSGSCAEQSTASVAEVGELEWDLEVVLA